MTENNYLFEMASPWQTAASGDIKTLAEDFVVAEELSFALDGSGDHLYLHIKKTGENTNWVAGQLAKQFNLKNKDVGYAGLKDRHAVTTQWFSILMPPKHEVEIPKIFSDNVECLEVKRHRKKLKKGSIKNNKFSLVVRHVKAKESLEKALTAVQKQGFPNYFGPQRFGRGFNNLVEAEKLFTNKQRRVPRSKQGIYLSAARSYIFNQILKQRVIDNSWNQCVEGDVMMLNGSRSIFVPETYDDVLQQRVRDMDIHPTAALWGKGELLSSADIKTLEQSKADANEVLKTGLETAGLNQERRALRVFPENFTWSWVDETTLALEFALPSGCYATSLLDAVLQVNDVQHQQAQHQ
ncbi:MAG: tRNA pseudouridine(13) synthase TruD [Gammaproteobacteria bacterium]|nr:tRNA pseudouridine(13) synthase TruD [Gammaproteobacteria bacterium]